METISTLIEFAEASNPHGNTPATGDFIGVAIVLAALVFATVSIIFVRMQNKSVVTGKHVLNNENKNPITVIFVLLATCLLAVGLISNVSNAIAGPEGIASATEKVYAYVDTETGEVSFENGYIKSNVPQDVNSVAVKVDMLDSSEFSYNFNWQVKIGDEVVYNGVAQDLKHDFYIDVKDAQTSFEITNLSISDAKALIGKEVAKVSFCATTLKQVQSDAYFEIYDKVDASLDNISAIPTTSLLDEDRAAINTKISNALEEGYIGISETEDEDKLAEIVEKEKADIQAFVNEAKATAEQTVADKQSFITEKSDAIASLKNKVDAEPLLNNQDKSEFKCKYNVVLQAVEGINQITSRVVLESQKSNIDTKLAEIDSEIAARIAQRFIEYKQNAVSEVEKLKDDGVKDIDDIDNLSEGKKTEFKKNINDVFVEALAVIEDATNTEDVDSTVDDYSSTVDEQITAAEAIAYRAWTLKDWTPEISMFVKPDSYILLTNKAEVSNDDKYFAQAPSPKYYFEEPANNDYFTLVTNEHNYAQLNVKNDVPYGVYLLTIYAQFDSVVDYGYVTKTETLTFYVNVTQFTETVLKDDIHLLLDYSADDYLLDYQGQELKDAGAKAGDYVSFYYSPAEGFSDFWNAQIQDGNWGGEFFNLYKEIYEIEGHMWKFNLVLTEEILNKIYNHSWAGGSFIAMGQGLFLEKITLISFPSFEKTLGDYSSDPLIADGWGQQGIPQPTVLSDGGRELKEVGARVGNYINFYLEKMPDTPAGDFWVLEIMEGHWNPLLTYANLCELGYPWPEGRVEYNLNEHNGVFSLLITQEMLDYAYTEQGFDGVFVLNGDNTMCTKVTLSNFAY